MTHFLKLWEVYQLQNHCARDRHQKVVEITTNVSSVLNFGLYFTHRENEVHFPTAFYCKPVISAIHKRSTPKLTKLNAPLTVNTCVHFSSKRREGLYHTDIKYE